MVQEDPSSPNWKIVDKNQIKQKPKINQHAKSQT